MTLATGLGGSSAGNGAVPRREAGRGASIRRGLLLVALLAGAGAGLLAAGAAGPAESLVRADDGLVRLLRFMALLKTAMAMGAAAAVWWRLSNPATAARLLVYLAAGAATMAGPGLIWGMAHLALGAFLLHAGLLTTLVALWRDPATVAKLAAAAAARRRAPAR